MKLALAVVGVLWCGGVWQMQAANSKPFVIPEIESWTPGEGSVSLSGRVVVKSEKLRSVAEAFADDYRTMFGRKLTVTKGKARKGDVSRDTLDETLPRNTFQPILCAQIYTFQIICSICSG